MLWSWFVCVVRGVGRAVHLHQTAGAPAAAGLFLGAACGLFLGAATAGLFFGAAFDFVFAASSIFLAFKLLFFFKAAYSLVSPEILIFRPV